MTGEWIERGSLAMGIYFSVLEIQMRDGKGLNKSRGEGRSSTCKRGYSLYSSIDEEIEGDGEEVSMTVGF